MVALNQPLLAINDLVATYPWAKSRTIARWIDVGVAIGNRLHKLPAVRVGGKWLVDPVQFEAFIAAMQPAEAVQQANADGLDVGVGAGACTAAVTAAV